MKRDLAITALVAAGLSGLLLLLLLPGVVSERIGNSVVLIGFGIALLLGGGALARVSTATYRHSPGTERLGRAAFIALGAISLLLGLVGLFRGG